MKVKVRKKDKIIYVLCYHILLVEEEAMTRNPAYEEGMILLLKSVITHYTVHALKMRRVELEANPSYITIQPNIVRADYEEISYYN